MAVGSQEVCGAIVDAFGAFPKGAQFCVARDGKFESANDFSSRERTNGRADIFNVYCAGKPFLVAAALRELHARGVEVEPWVRMADLTEARARLSTATFGDLLSHRTGCVTPDLYTFMSAAPKAQDLLVPTVETLTVRAPKAAYSPVVLAAGLDAVLRRRTPSTLASAASKLAADLNMPDTFVRDSRPRSIGAYIDTSGDRPLPMLHDRLERYRDSKHGHLTGLYTTARDMATFGDEFNACWADDQSRIGLPPGVLQSHLKHSESAGATDERYTLGLSHLRHNGVLGASSTAVGHFGFVRSSLFYLDPARRTVLAGIVPDLQVDDLEGRLQAWSQLCSAIAGSDTEI